MKSRGYKDIKYDLLTKMTKTKTKTEKDAIFSEKESAIRISNMILIGDVATKSESQRITIIIIKTEFRKDIK